MNSSFPCRRVQVRIPVGSGQHFIQLAMTRCVGGILGKEPHGIISADPDIKTLNRLGGSQVRASANALVSLSDSLSPARTT